MIVLGRQRGGAISTRTVVELLYRVPADLTRNTLWALVGAACSQTSSLVAGVVLGRMLGVTGFGELALIQATLLLLGNLGEAGLTVATTKFSGQWRTADPARAGRLIGSVLRLTAVSGVFMALVFAGFRPYLGLTIAAPTSTELVAGAGLLIFDMLNRIQFGALAGLEAFKASTRIYIWRGVLTLPCVWLGVRAGNLSGAILAMGAVSGVTFAIGHLRLQEQCRARAIQIGYTAPFEIGILSTSLSLWMSSFLVAGSAWAVSFLLSRHSGFAELGIFNAATRWSMVLLFLPNALFQVVLPMLAHKHAAEDYQSCGRIIATVLSVTLVVTGVGAMLVAALSPIVMRWYGDEFKVGINVLSLAALGAIVSAIYTVGSGIVWATDRPIRMLRVDFFKAILLLALCLMGFSSSAWNVTVAYAVSFSVGSVLLMWTLYSQIHRQISNYAANW